MAEITLDRAEVLVLLEALQAERMVGFEREQLIPQEPMHYASAISRGQALLEERGGLRRDDDGKLALNRDLVMAASALAFPSVASIMLRDIPSVGPQVFIFAEQDGRIIEHTQPVEGQHRWASLATRQELVARLLALLPVADSLEADASLPAEMGLAQFLSVKTAAEAGDLAQATQALRAAGMRDEDALALIEAIRQPDFSANLAVLKCRNQQIVDARNPIILSSTSSAWLVLPMSENAVKVQAVSRDMLEATLAKLWADFSEEN